MFCDGRVTLQWRSTSCGVLRIRSMIAHYRDTFWSCSKSVHDAWDCRVSSYYLTVFLRRRTTLYDLVKCRTSCSQCTRVYINQICRTTIPRCCRISQGLPCVMVWPCDILPQHATSCDSLRCHNIIVLVIGVKLYDVVRWSCDFLNLASDALQTCRIKCNHKT
jgi:hypothetical protein